MKTVLLLALAVTVGGCATHNQRMVSAWERSQQMCKEAGNPIPSSLSDLPDRNDRSDRNEMLMALS